MNKQEFLDALGKQLSGFPPEERDERLSFYAEMIDDRMEAGLSEADAVKDLGTPEAIAEQILKETPLITLAKKRMKPSRSLKAWVYVPQVGIINPGEFNPINSIELVIWVAVGGRASLYGAIIGAILVNYSKTLFTGIFPDEWLYALGLLFVLVTLFLPKGVIGLIEIVKARKTSNKNKEAADAIS